MFESTGLALEGVLLESAVPRLCAVVAHPHPQFGGDMHNHVVVALGRALWEAGATVLRFNFQGVGSSEGSYDGGRGEGEDVLGGVRIVRGSAPGVPLIAAGYSFGAQVVASVAVAMAPAAMVLVSPPVGFAPLPTGVPLLAITGDRDDICPPTRLQEQAGTDRVVVVPGCDHGWWSGTEPVVRALSGFVRGLLDTSM